MPYPPAPPRWLWFVTVVGLAALATLVMASGRGPPALHELALAPNAAAASAADPGQERPAGCGDRNLRFCEFLPN